jgi:hypothetical protein
MALRRPRVRIPLGPHNKILTTGVVGHLPANSGVIGESPKKCPQSTQSELACLPERQDVPVKSLAGSGKARYS